jgi:uncharacterized membrane protein YphA (DoxX/SURF4 family)
MNGKKIGYWTTTLIVAGMMLLTGSMYLSGAAQVLEAFAHLGYPPYFRVFLGTAKLLGAVALLYPRVPRMTEWAYAGFTFTFLGAAWSHYGAGDGIGKAVAPLVLLALLLVSDRLRERIA